MQESKSLQLEVDNTVAMSLLSFLDYVLDLGFLLVSMQLEELVELTMSLHEVEDEDVAVEAGKVLAVDVILALYVVEGVSLLEVPVELTNPLHEVKDEAEGIEVDKVVAVEVPKVLVVEAFLVLYMVADVCSLDVLVEMLAAELDLTIVG